MRTDLVHWNNVLLATGLIKAEDIHKMPHSYDIFHKFCKGSLDKAIGSYLLKARSLNYSSNRKSLNRSRDKITFSAEH